MMPTDWTKGLMPFDLYIRAADSLPVYTEVEISAEKNGVFFKTEIEYSQIDGFQLTKAITTTVEFTDLSNFIYKTSFSDYEINPADTVLLEGKEKSAIENDNVDEDAFADIYHGFEAPPLVVKLGGENALYTKLRFAFALEAPSKQVVKELEKKHAEITAAVCNALEGRLWGDIKDRSYEIGLELTDIINGELATGKVTDFYFTIFNAER
jgi:flagellar basal body-associated protein FliL